MEIAVGGDTICYKKGLNTFPMGQNFKREKQLITYGNTIR